MARRHSLGKRSCRSFLCAAGTSSPSSLFGARCKHLALFPYHAQPKKGKETLPSPHSRIAKKVLALPLHRRRRIHKPAPSRGPPQPTRLPSLAPSSYGGGCRFSPLSVMGGVAPSPAHAPRDSGSHRSPPTSPAHPGPLSPPSPLTHRRLAGRCPRGGRPVPAGRAAALQLPLAVQGPEPHVGQEDEGGQRQPHRLQQPLLLPPHGSGCRARAEQRDGAEGEQGARSGRPRRAPGAQLSPALGGGAGRQLRHFRSARARGGASQSPPTARGGPAPLPLITLR